MMGDFNFDNEVENENIGKLSSKQYSHLTTKMGLSSMFGPNYMI